MKRQDYVTASEIGDFVFCKRGWWLRLNGLLQGDTDTLRAGVRKHEELTRDVNTYPQRFRVVLTIIVIAVLALLIVFLLKQ